MIKSEDISFTTLHLEGEAHELWYHGLVTLGHSYITSYSEFTERLMERFERRDQELHLRDLTQLEKTRSVESFITLLQQKEVALSDISKHRMVMMFIEVLIEPLRGCIKSFKPHTLMEAIVHMRDIGEFPDTFPNKSKITFQARRSQTPSQLL
jgi:hypothetical protein